MASCNSAWVEVSSESTPLLGASWSALGYSRPAYSKTLRQIANVDHFKDEVLSFYSRKTVAAVVGRSHIGSLPCENARQYTLEVLESRLAFCGLVAQCCNPELERCALPHGARIEVLEVVESLDSSEARARVLVTDLPKVPQEVEGAKWCGVPQLWKWTKRQVCGYMLCKRNIAKEGMSFHRDARLHDVGWIDAELITLVSSEAPSTYSTLEKEVEEGYHVEHAHHHGSMTHLLDSLHISSATDDVIQEEQKINNSTTLPASRPQEFTSSECVQTRSAEDSSILESEPENCDSNNKTPPTEWELFVMRLKEESRISMCQVRIALELAKSSSAKRPALSSENNVDLLNEVTQLDGFSPCSILHTLFPSLAPAPAQRIPAFERVPLAKINENVLNIRPNKSTMRTRTKMESKLHEWSKHETNVCPRKCHYFSQDVVKPAMKLYFKRNEVLKDLTSLESKLSFIDDIAGKIEYIALYDDSEIKVFLNTQVNDRLSNSEQDCKEISHTMTSKGGHISVKATQCLKSLVLRSLYPKRIPNHVQMSHELELFLSPCVRLKASEDFKGALQIKLARPGDIRCRGLFGSLIMNIAMTLQASSLNVEAAHLGCSLQLEDVVLALSNSNCQNQNSSHYDAILNEHLYIQTVNNL